MDRTDELIEALIEASSHVTRQEQAGKHEQDRVDSMMWQYKWGELVRWARSQPRAGSTWPEVTYMLSVLMDERKGGA